MYDLRVSNLPDNTSPSDLRALFSEKGFCDIAIKDQKEFDGGKEPSVEYVRLKEGDRIEDAIKRLNNLSWKGHEIQVEVDFRYSASGHLQAVSPAKPKSGNQGENTPKE